MASVSLLPSAVSSKHLGEATREATARLRGPAAEAFAAQARAAGLIATTSEEAQDRIARAERLLECLR